MYISLSLALWSSTARLFLAVTILGAARASFRLNGASSDCRVGQDRSDVAFGSEGCSRVLVNNTRNCQLEEILVDSRAIQAEDSRGECAC